MYAIADYLLDIVSALGAKEIFGVPGDYELNFLDHVTSRKDLKWVGNANELNAAYMADGYARKKGFATLITTFGVGELSALNGFAGSKAENVPVLEIAGSPNTASQKNKALVHHTLGDGNFIRFENAHRALGFKVAHLTADNAVNKINNLIKYILKTRKPAYLTIPTDVAEIKLNPKLKSEVISVVSHPEIESDAKVIQKITRELKEARRPMVMVGHEVSRFKLEKYVQKFITDNNLPYTNNGFSKGVLSESLPQFIGTYNGDISSPKTKKIVDKADLILLLGTKLTDMTTGGFTQSFGNDKTIDLNINRLKIFGQIYADPNFYNFPNTIKKLSNLKNLNLKNQPTNFHPVPEKVSGSNTKLTQEFYDKALISSLKPKETLISENGTSFSGTEDKTLPQNVRFIAAPLWASIGYTFPSALGSQIADPTSRSVLSIGEGSLQMTIQEFSTAFRESLHPIILVIENHGYTVERFIHGMNQRYNDVPHLDYKKLPLAFGGNQNNYLALDASKENELLSALKKAQSNKDKLVLIDVKMDEKDAPWGLRKLAKKLAENNEKK